MANTCYFLPIEDEYILALLASKLIPHYYKGTSAAVRGGYLLFFTQYVIQLPIATVDEETKTYITELVNQILYIKQADAAADTSALEAEIDLLVYRLYRLTYDEVLLVSPDFALPRAAYKSSVAFSLTG